MKINLKKPLCVFDLETTGTNITKDRIVQIAIVKIMEDGSVIEYNELVNPEVTISEEIAEIHGITYEMVKNAPTIKTLGPAILAFIGDADLAGYNSNKFDIPVLVEELLRVGIPVDFSDKSFVDIQNIFHKMEQRTLAAAYQFYCGKTMDNAHNALYDTQVTWEVLKAQLERYPELDSEINALANFSRQSNYAMVDFAGRLAHNDKGEVVYNFGKHKGKTIAAVMQNEPGYYGWMLEADFPHQTKQCLRKEMDEIKRKKEATKESEIQDKLGGLLDKFNKK